MFSKNEIAHNQNISQNLWEKLSKKELSDYNKSRVKNYMQDQMLSLNTPLKYNDMNYEKDPQKILNLLGLKSAQKIISIFPNQDWDSTALGIDDAFKNQYDFLEYIFFLSKNFPNYHFILRPHPADAKLGKHARSVRTFDIYLSEEFRNKIPKNFIILKPGVELNSYSLAKISSHRIVYGSTLGLEFSFLKLKTIVAGAAFYKHRGFTIDVKKRYDINKILNQNNLNPRLSKKEHKLLERFIYVSKFRKLFSLPFFSKNKFPICQISNNNFFFNKTINNISDYILDKRNYLDLDK